MLYSALPSEVFAIILDYVNEMREKHRLELDMDFIFRQQRLYELNEYGFLECEGDGTAEAILLYAKHQGVSRMNFFTSMVRVLV